MGKTKKIVMSIVGLVAFAGCLVLGAYYVDSGEKKITSDNVVVIEVGQGESIMSVARKLKSEGLIKYPKLFVLHGEVSKKSSGLKYGLHAVKVGMSYDRIYDSINSSKKTLDVYNKVTIPEGFTVQQIAAKLSENGIVNKERFLDLAKRGDFEYWFLEDVPIDQGEFRLEGFMYPQTYYFEKGATEEAIITEMLSEFEMNIKKYKDKVDAAEFYDIIKIASIVERETFIENEKNMVAGVFYNRLSKGVKLESCATVEYVLNVRKKVLSLEDISIDNPYNTYRNKGLPPTPISNPSIESIEAAINPVSTEYMFFVANKDGNGHVFSKTYEEHLKNIEKYR